MPTLSEKTNTISDTEAERLGAKGLFFRPAIPYKITIKYKTPSGPAHYLINDTQQFLLPDTTRLYSIDFPRVAFVTHEKEIGFTNGMLTDFREKMPSPLLGFLGLPKAIVEAVVPIPGVAGVAGSGSTSTTAASKP
jgi:hypothetical protein